MNTSQYNANTTQYKENTNGYQNSAQLAQLNLLQDLC